MKKLFNVLALTLAMNFVAVAAGVGWLYNAGHLDRQKVTAIREIVFPATMPSADTEKKRGAATTRPTFKLEELLAKQRGKPADEQVEFMQRSFDIQMAELDRKTKELEALKTSVDAARTELAVERSTFNTTQEAFKKQQQEAAQLASDKGFADALGLYTSMPAKQAKEMFANLDDATMQRYLQAMEPRTATKIIKEFKTPDEIKRIQRVLEQMHAGQNPQQQASVKEQQ